MVPVPNDAALLKLTKPCQLSLFVQGQHGDGRNDIGGQLNLRVGF